MDAAEELAVPAPFTLVKFAVRLERLTGRAVELVSVAMRPDAPSGVRIGTDRTDYFYYERRTSGLHQAHIVLSLAARMLLDKAPAPVDQLLVPEVSPQLIGLMFGTSGGHAVPSWQVATFAYLVLERARQARHRPLMARSVLRQLEPLHALLLDAVPEIKNGTASGLDHIAKFRLYRHVIAMRDALLLLRPHGSPDVALAAEREGRAAGLSGMRLVAEVQAADLAHALAARQAGEPAGNGQQEGPWDMPASADLRDEAACLVRLAQALALLRKRHA